MFIVETVDHYYHTEFNHDERSVYKYYNIGNTKLVDAEQFKLEDVLEEVDFYNFDYEGICYCQDGSTFKAIVSFDYIDCAYLERKTYTLLPEVEGLPVKEISFHFYDKYYGLDLTGYGLKLYIDDEGYYCGEYESQGFLKYWGDIYNHFGRYGGEIFYYYDWNN